MTDIVKRLRNLNDPLSLETELCNEAADEIERLQAENALLKDIPRIRNLFAEAIATGEPDWQEPELRPLHKLFNELLAKCKS